MNLDDRSIFRRLDSANLLEQIERLPGELEAAWKLGLRLPLPAWQGVCQVVLAGMGDSGLGAELLAAYAAPRCPVPITVWRNDGLPAWARQAQTLVITCSLSGNTAETISAYEAGLESGCSLLAVTNGGRLAQLAQANRQVLWRDEQDEAGGTAVAFSFGLLLAVFQRLGLLPDPEADLNAAIAAMRVQQATLGVEIPAVRNLAKRTAGQLMGRMVVVFGADHLEPVARRWKSQINLMSKTWAQMDALPEADHNTLSGSLHPEALVASSMALFLRGHALSKVNRRRTELTKQALMLEGFNTDFIDAQGGTRLAEMWTALHLGDYSAYYLAIAYGVDPAPSGVIESFKRELGG